MRTSGPLSRQRFVPLVWLVAASSFGPVSAQPLADPPPSAVLVRFIDSATGCAVQPESVATRAHQPDATEQRLGAGQIAPSGHTALLLGCGRHTITVVAPDYQTGFGEFEMTDANPYDIRFLLDPLVPPPELQPERIIALHREDATLILGFVVDDDSGEPLQGVRVSSAPSGAAASTDERGYFQLYVAVQSEAEAESAPASLTFEKHGFRAEERQQLELWPNGDWTYCIRLSRGGGKTVVDEREFRRRPSPNLTGVAPKSSSTAPADSAPAAAAQSLYSAEPPVAVPLATDPTNATVRVPRNIRVLKSDNVTIDYVTLDYYCKHVLPAEWIAGWAGYTGGSNSLNAGAVAVRTYAIGYINTPKGSTYDICATTSCQVYGTATSTYSDTAVNFTANYVELNSSGAIPSGLTEYSAENNSLANSCGDGFTEPSTTGPVCIYDPVCAGETRNGHGRGMCQWGSAKWATGLKFPGNKTTDHTTLNGFPRRGWIWICQHYYPSLTLVKGAPLIVGDDVKALKTLDVRACGDGGITDGINCALVTTKAAGATGTIVGGPTQVSSDGAGFTWYQVQWSDATVGWSAENFLERVFSTPTAPAALTAVATGTNQINLAWSDTSSVETGFSIERAIASGGPWLALNTVAAGVTAYPDGNLYPGSTWYYRVRAFNAGGYSPYSGVASATTSNTAPVLAAIGSRTVTEGATVSFTNSATASDFVLLLTDFESFPTETANGVVMFRDPRYSGSTSSFLDATPDLAAITDVFSTSGNSSTRVLRINCNFTNNNNPWLRLTTSSAATWPNPVIDFTKKLRFSLYADKAVQVALGCRETGTAAGTPIGTNGGTSGGIEWVGVTNKAGTAPMPTRTVPASQWTTLLFDLPNEPVLNFSGGNGVLPASLGVLEHLAFVPAGGTGIYNLYLDNLAVLAPRTLTYSLAPGAPGNASLDAASGVFAWPTAGWANTTNTITVRVTDNSTPSLTDSKTFTVTVVPKPTVLAAPLAGSSLKLTWNSIPATTYRVQFKQDLTDPSWTDLSPDVLASGPTAAFTNAPGIAQRFYRVLVVGN